MKLPPDYLSRVYAGVLGKIIGVYLGRPFENWPHAAIAERWGEIRRYVNQDRNVPLVVTDDDITGTFTFIRALLDHGIKPDLSAREIGQTWLNYIAEKRHILWWGGLAVSAEHTAFLRLAAGIEAPQSGSAELNGPAVAEEIGSQIFIDGWALVSPGNPDQAVRFAREAASVSHDGEAIHGAVVIAAMEAQAFVEKDIQRLLDVAVGYIPSGSRIARVIADLRRWHREDPDDWRKARERLVADHGYQHFGTGCPIISNHGLIILALLYGNGDFDRSLMIANTCGYDTDCNSGNLGCLLGIRNGLAAFQGGYDWRGPVNDRMFLPAADGHWGVRDAANMALELANIGRALAGEAPLRPKGGARYAFALPGCTHGFAPSGLCPSESRVAREEDTLVLQSEFPGLRCDAQVATFLPKDSMAMPGYGVTATPTLYPGNRIKARVIADKENRPPIKARLFIRNYQHGTEDLALHEGDPTELAAGQDAVLEWVVPDTNGWPVAEVGVRLEGPVKSRLHLDCLTWDDAVPSLKFECPPGSPSQHIWQKMFLGSMEDNKWGWEAAFHFLQSRGRGVLHTGSRGWKDYRVEATLKPWLAREFALLGRVQGLTRYYALSFRKQNRIALVRMNHEETVLAAAEFPWQLAQEYDVAFELNGSLLTGYVKGRKVIQARDPLPGLDGGGIGFALDEGRLRAGGLSIQPVGGSSARGLPRET